MIIGLVNDYGEAMLRVVIGNLETKRMVVDALLDTGYTGHLTLPLSTIESLNLPWLGSEKGTLADGSTHMFDVYSAMIIWDGARQRIKVNESDGGMLIGVGLLYGYEVCIQTVSGGSVTIKALPG